MSVTIDESVIRSTVREVCEVPDQTDIADRTLDVLIDEAVSMVCNSANWLWRLSSVSAKVPSIGGRIALHPTKPITGRIYAVTDEEGTDLTKYVEQFIGQLTLHPPEPFRSDPMSLEVFFISPPSLSQIPNDMRVAVLNWVISRTFDILDDSETATHWAAQVANFLEAQKLQQPQISRSSGVWVMNDSVSEPRRTGASVLDWGF